MEDGARTGGRLAGLGLFFQALRLAKLAQQVRHRPVDQVARRMTALAWLPGNVSGEAAVLAAIRAAGWWSRLTAGLDSCLVRCLAVGALLSDRPGIVLHLGFRATTETGSPHDGHAWLTMEGRDLPWAVVTVEPGEPFTEVRAIPMSRGEANR